MSRGQVLLLGPSGSGKTHLMRALAKLLGVPFAKGDATKFSATGFVGGDVDDLVRSLLPAAGGDHMLAEHGIVYIDEASCRRFDCTDALCHLAGHASWPDGGGLAGWLMICGG